jgi:transposase InsO family protein
VNLALQDCEKLPTAQVFRHLRISAGMKIRDLAKLNNKFLYLSVVMDIRRRKILGWSLDDTLSSEGVIRALERSCLLEGTVGSIFHSDQGVLYKSFSLTKY